MKEEELKQRFQVTDEFNFTEGNFCGRRSFLISPKNNPDWSTTTPFNRSRVISEDGEILSQSFPKFWNEGEHPELYPNPLDFDDWEIYQKIDGSTLILDMVDGIINMRTRGILNYKTQLNAADFELLFVKYPQVKSLLDFGSGYYTLLFEIVTPNNKIVIDYGAEVDFYFIGSIFKPNGELCDELQLDTLAKKFSLKRPRKYNFKDMGDLKSIVKAWKSDEGVVVTYNMGQNKVKVKADRYCFLHAIMSGLMSKKDVIDKFIALKYPNEETFIKYYETEFDYEISVMMQPLIKEICEKYEIIKKDFSEVKRFVDSINCEEFTRAELASQIIHKYIDWRKGFAFNCLDNKPLDEKAIKKLLLKNDGCS